LVGAIGRSTFANFAQNRELKGGNSPIFLKVSLKHTIISEAKVVFDKMR
jgi:hypothetical protein